MSRALPSDVCQPSDAQRAGGGGAAERALDPAVLGGAAQAEALPETQRNVLAVTKRPYAAAHARRMLIVTQCSPSAHPVRICSGCLAAVVVLHAEYTQLLYLPYTSLHLPISPYIPLYLLHAEYAQLVPRALGQRLPLVDLQEM